MKNYMKKISLLIAFCLLLSVGMASNVFAEDVTEKLETEVEETAEEVTDEEEAEEVEKEAEEAEETEEAEEVEEVETEEAEEVETEEAEETEEVEEVEEVEELAVNVVAKPNSSPVLVNGEKVEFEAYTIDQNNYFKLRDLAMVLNGTGKNFQVEWNQEEQAINLVSNTEYTPAGGELVVSEELAEKEGTLNTAKIYLDGEEIEIAAYTIGGNNYFKLRDLGQIFDFNVGWDQDTKTISIDTSLGYDGEAVEEVEEVEEAEETEEVEEAEEVEETDEKVDETEEEAEETEEEAAE